ncbi:MAG: AMP-binding protein [Nanoarchaeota archaeon]|nr:AMP-binding protein [Nanoarchaeota archaeon]
MNNKEFWEDKEKDIIFQANKLNIIESCVDRHAKKNPNKLAFVFEFENKSIKKYTYKELEKEVNQFANYLNSLKIKKNSRIFLFLPKLPEMYIAFLAVIKQGSIAVPLFEAFQSEGLDLRLQRGDADVLITNKELTKRLSKEVKKKIKTLKNIIIIDDQDFKKKLEKQKTEFKAVLKNKKDTAFMIFTSSTAGTPIAGIQIPHYALIQQHFTAKLVLDLKQKDNYWCTAHPGWITGAVYGILAPLSIGCTNFILEAHFDAKKWIEFLKRNKISVMYTAPTALRMLKPEIKKEDFKGIRNIASVGEALTSSVFDFYKNLGIEINDSYWQTETGALMISNTPLMKKKSGSMGKPLPGINATIKDGMIIIKKSWPAMMTGIYKHEKMYKEYFNKKWFKTNDLARIDNEGYFFFEARKDDMIKSSGERISPIEIESILMKHKAVKETAVIGIPDEIKGQIIKAFIVLNKGFEETNQLKEELMSFVKQNYAGHSYPKQIQFIKEFPKTNSGKIIKMELKNLK